MASVAEVYKVVLLNELGTNYMPLSQIAILLEKGKELVESIITSFESNDVYGCGQKLRTLKKLTVGNNPLSGDL